MGLKNIRIRSSKRLILIKISLDAFDALGEFLYY